MDNSNIILKTAMKTVLGLLAALVLVFGVLSLGFPQTMAGMCEKMGNYSFATGYASLRYSYTGDVDDLARCAVDSIMSEKYGNIVNFCGKLVKHRDFDEYCGDDSVRRQYIYGNLCVAEYNIGRVDDAFEHALNAMEGVSDYPTGNALNALSIEVIEARDAETAAEICAVLDRFSPTESQQKAYSIVSAELTKLIQQTE